MNIDLTFDSSTNGAPSAFFAAMNAVAQYLDGIFLNPITVNITVGYGKIKNTDRQAPPNERGNIAENERGECRGRYQKFGERRQRATE
jgi:hypothetical protein